MSDPQQLDRELREYLEKEPNLRREDRITALKAIFLKHFEFQKLDHVINMNDLWNIIGDAKGQFVNQRSNIFITRKQVDPTQKPQVAMVEAFLSYANRMNLLKKQVKFDYTE